MWRRRFLVAAVFVLVAAGAGGSIAAHWPIGVRTSSLSASWQDTKTCRGPDIIFTPNTRWFSVRFPLRVSMTFATASAIADGVAPKQLGGSHPAPRGVPCDIAFNVARRATNAWSVRPIDKHLVTARWADYASGPRYRFDCLVTATAPHTLATTCLLRRTRLTGTIRVRFAFHRLA
jgi:hypothetical protein